MPYSVEKVKNSQIDQYDPLGCFLQLSRDLLSDFVPLLSERVTYVLFISSVQDGIYALGKVNLGVTLKPTHKTMDQ